MNDQPTIIEQPNQSDIVRPVWTDLDTEQQNGVLALALAPSVNRAAAIFKTTAKKSRAYFYSKVYPVIKDYWREMVKNLPTEALLILQGGAVKAASELVVEIGHKDVRIRNKASNDILDKVMTTKRDATGVSIKDGDKEIKVIVTRG